MLIEAEHRLGLGPVAMARAMNVTYHTYDNWKTERREIPPVAVRCLELLMMYPRTAKKFSERL